MFTKMANDSEQENLLIEDAIESPLMIFRGEGSGKNCNVGNDKEKSNIFFFGQPGCLKHSPIKTFSTESITSLNSFKSSSSSSTETPVECIEKSDNSLTLSTKSSNNEESSSTSSVNDNNKPETEKCLEKVETDSNKNNNEKDLKNPSNEAVNSEQKSISSENSSSQVLSEKLNENTHSKNEINEHKSESLPSKCEVKSVEIVQIKSSIVPYDDDSSSSQDAIEENIASEVSKPVESASEISEKDDKIEDEFEIKSLEETTSKTEHDIANVETKEVEKIEELSKDEEASNSTEEVTEKSVENVTEEIVEKVEEIVEEKSNENGEENVENELINVRKSEHESDPVENEIIKEDVEITESNEKSTKHEENEEQLLVETPVEPQPTHDVNDEEEEGEETNVEPEIEGKSDLNFEESEVEEKSQANELTSEEVAESSQIEIEPVEETSDTKVVEYDNIESQPSVETGVEAQEDLEISEIPEESNKVEEPISEEVQERPKSTPVDVPEEIEEIPQEDSPPNEENEVTEEISESQSNFDEISKIEEESKVEEIEKTEIECVKEQGMELNSHQEDLENIQEQPAEVEPTVVENEIIENVKEKHEVDESSEIFKNHETSLTLEHQKEDEVSKIAEPAKQQDSENSDEILKISETSIIVEEKQDAPEASVESKTFDKIEEEVEKPTEVSEPFLEKENQEEVQNEKSIQSPQQVEPEESLEEKEIVEQIQKTEETIMLEKDDKIDEKVHLEQDDDEQSDNDDNGDDFGSPAPFEENDDNDDDDEEPEKVENNEASIEKVPEPEKPENDLPQKLDEVEVAKETEEIFSKPSTRKRKISERKSISESDSDSNVVTDTVSQDNNTSEDEVAVKKPRMRNKTTTPKKVAVARRNLRGRKQEESPEPAKEIVTEKEETKVESEVAEEKKDEKTLQNFQFDYDANEDVVANVAAIKTLIRKDKKSSDESDSDTGNKKAANKRGRKGKRGRFSKAKNAESSDDDNKRSKPSDEQKDQTKKRNSGRGLLKYIDTSLVIETVENEAPVRQSRRIAQLKIREETDRRLVEEKLLQQLKTNAEKKKSGPVDEDYENEKESSDEEAGDDDSVKGSKRKRKSKIKASDKQWQTSSSHSEDSEKSDDEIEHVPSDPGSPLFKSDHEFSPESEDEDDAVPSQPLKRARTAKKIEVEDEDEEDINPNHACQVCHKTDSPEWILLCDECDCGYHCSCLKPIIFLIPSGNWYCPQCCHKKLVENLSEQLTKLDTLKENIETAELRKQRQRMLEITAQNIIEEERRKKRERSPVKREKLIESESSKSGSSDSDSSDDAPLIYKLRKRNQTATSYRFNEYDALINSAIKEEMDEVKGAGNLGRGKDISTIIEADKEEKRSLKREFDDDDEGSPRGEAAAKDDDDSSGSDIIRRKKNKRKKKSRRLNNLDSSSDVQSDADESFKGSTPSSDSEVDEEDLSMSSVSESSLDLPRKKGAAASRGLRTRTRQKRIDHFIDDNSNDSDDEPLVVAKRTRKKNDSDEEDFDINDGDDDEENSEIEDIDSEDLCDDTDSSDSSESAWPKKKKKRAASYDQKPRKPAKKKIVEDEDKAFRAGISKKKILKQQLSENESEASEDETGKGRRTRGKKLLYLIEDDLESDESDGIRPGVKRPETPPEEREMFFKKQEEIKRMLAAKDTEAAKKLAAPTIEPINVPLEPPESPTFADPEPSSLSTIPMNVIESAKALDTDYNRVMKPIYSGSKSQPPTQNEMNEEELAKMMEDEDFAQHQLKLAGDAIAKKKLLEFEAKEDAFAAFTKSKEKELSTPEKQKRAKKPKVDKALEEINKTQPTPIQMLQHQTNLATPPVPPLMNPQQIQHKPQQLPPHPSMQQSPIMANFMHQQHQQQPSPHQIIQQQPPYVPSSAGMMPDRPSVLSNYMNRPLTHPPPQHLKVLQSPSPPHHLMKPQIQSPPPSQMQPKSYSPKTQMQMQAMQQQQEDELKKSRRKKSSSRPEMLEGNIPKHAKIDGPPSVIQSPMNPSMIERLDDKSKARMDHNVKLAVAAPPQIFNPGTAPTPSVITRLLQPQQRHPGPYPQGPPGQQPPPQESQIRMYPTPESQVKNLPPGSKIPAQQGLPPTSFADHPAFVGRAIPHPSLYRGPPNPYGIPPHARLPPYPFHHLHPNLRPEFSSPYNIPPQFGYYAPPAAHGRQPGPIAAPHMAGNEEISNSIRNPNNSEENEQNSSEFGGLVSYFSSQQELD